MAEKKTEKLHMLEVEKDVSNLKDHTHLQSSTFTLIFAISISLASVLTYSCFLSMATYFKDKFNPDMYNTAIFYDNVGSLIGLLLYKQIAQRVAAGRLIMSLIVANLICSVAIMIIGETMTKSFLKILIGSLVVFIVGFSGNLLQCSSINIFFQYDHKVKSFYNGGFALSGITTTTVAMIQTNFVSETDIFRSAFYYMIFHATICVGVFIISWKYFQQHPEHNICYPSIENSEYRVSKVTLSHTFKKVYPILVSLFFIFFMSIAMPVLCALGLKLGIDNRPSLTIQIVYLIYHISDLIGKISYSWLKLENLTAAHSLTLSKIFLIVIPILALSGSDIASLRDNWKITVTLIMLEGSSKGYLNSCYYHLASCRVSQPHLSNTSYLCLISLIVGMLYGSFINMVGTSN